MATFSGGTFADSPGSTFADIPDEGDFDAGDIDFDGDVDFDDMAAGDLTWPGITVAIAPGYTMTDADKVWVNISNQVLVNPGITISRGQGRQYDRDETAECQLTLIDTDRTFDPLNGLSPYVGLLVPWMPLRVVATYSGITYPLFVGGIESFPQTYDLADRFVTIPLVGHGWLGWLANRGFRPVSPLILDHLTAGILDSDRMLSGETPDLPSHLSGARIELLLDAAGVPSTAVNADPGVSMLHAGPPTGSLLEHLDLVRQTELGRLYEDAYGELQYKDRTHVEGAAVTAFFSDAGGWSVPYSALTIDAGDIRTLKNLVTRGSSTVVESTVIDSLSQERYGPITDEKTDLLFDTALDAHGQASYLIARHNAPQTRITSLVVKPRRVPEYLFPLILNPELSDLCARFTIARTPVGVGAAYVAEALVGRVEHKIGGREWVTTYQLYPPDTNDYWVLDDVAKGRLDAGNLISY